MLPESTLLGKLKMIEVYEYYTQPALFACVNRSGQIYLAVWTEESNDATRWLYVALSPTRFSQVRSGQVSLRDAFSGPEDGFALDVVEYRDPNLAPGVEPVPADEIREAWLPLTGEFLAIGTPPPPGLPLEVYAHSASSYSRPIWTTDLDVEWASAVVSTLGRAEYTAAVKPFPHGVYLQIAEPFADIEEDNWLESAGASYSHKKNVPVVG